jgi:hypothetical protein
MTGGAAAIIAGGSSFDSVFEAAGREKLFIPMMGTLYKGVFGEVASKTISTNLNEMVGKSLKIDHSSFVSSDETRIFYK